MNRRRFLTLLTSVLGLSALGVLTYPVLRLLSPLGGAARAKINLVFPRGEIPVGGAKDFLMGDTPSILINRGPKGFVAFSRVCTHLGCLVKYDKEKQVLICPCHAGTFDLQGNVISGPPPRPLARFPAVVMGANVVIG